MDGLYIPRAVSPHILEVQKYYSVIIVTGPRQSGKTTLCQHLFSDYKFATMDDIGTRTRALTDMDFFMDSLGENAVIDEVQNCPEVLTAVKNRVDRNSNCRYILTGSSNFSLLHSVSESLAERPNNLRHIDRHQSGRVCQKFGALICLKANGIGASRKYHTRDTPRTKKAKK